MKREHLTAGVDVGSSFVKVAVTQSRAGDSGEVLAAASQRIRRRNLRDVVRATFSEACAQAGILAKNLDYVASTGDGEGVEMATGHFYGMTTHARGALFLMPEARAVLDTGALHARAMRIGENSRVLAHRMTSQCASGSGQFIENIARYLGVPLEDVGELSLSADVGEDVSSVCAVLAETDVINMVSRGISTAAILRGIHESVGGRLAKLVRSVGAEHTVALTGGLSADAGLVRVMETLLGEDKRGRRAPLVVLRHAHSPVAGAIGAALLGAYRYQQLEKSGKLGTLFSIDKMKTEQLA